MSKIFPGKTMLFRPEAFDTEKWISDKDLERIFFLTPEEENALAEKKERDRKILKDEYFDESNY